MKTHENVGLVYNVCRLDYENEKLTLELWVDADHAGDAADAKSCSGWALVLKGPQTRAVLDACSKKQSATARSTPDAEVTVMCDGMGRCSGYRADHLRASVEAKGV